MTDTKRLLCCVCGETTTGRQHRNHDTGWGICPECYDRQVKREGAEETERCYGKPGVHHSLVEAGR